jgi:cell wall-associated NlpC family hydrolase
VATVRQKIVAAARWGIANEPRIHYGEIRPIPLGRRLPLTTDCSGFVTVCYYLAGAPDPNGRGYDGSGYTGTLLGWLRAIAPLDAKLGDLVVWGTYPGRHVALVLEPGGDPLLCSHGQERGPFAIRYSDECAFQPPVVTWLSGLPP